VGYHRGKPFLNYSGGRRIWRNMHKDDDVVCIYTSSNRKNTVKLKRRRKAQRKLEEPL